MHHFIASLDDATLLMRTNGFAVVLLLCGICETVDQVIEVIFPSVQ